MNVVVAIDSFKGSATSLELNQAVKEAIEADFSQVECVCIPIADGGEGSLEAIYTANGGHFQSCSTVDLLGRNCKTEYLITLKENKKIAIIESAKVVGLDLIHPCEETLCQASTYGLGLVVKDALEKRVNQIILTLGGSGTSDGGLGFLQALGADTGDTARTGNPLLVAKKLDLARVKQQFAQINLIAAADVTNVYYGSNGAAKVFGMQKGGSPEILEKLDAKAQRIATYLQEHDQIVLNQVAGSGAAGGLGGAIVALGGELQSGFELISQFTNLEQMVSKADLVFTGEGSIDSQTENGKVPFGIAQLTQKFAVPVVVLCGRYTAIKPQLAANFQGIFCIQSAPISLEEALKKENTLLNIANTAKNILKLFLFSKQSNLEKEW
ncbi:glycerate kinase [Vagococcus entomophilus]|uniref:Glycerate kinase n=1 Tax=Vagococcus entomophilus TaxID=1160095 RepID=A0A430AHM3_9ENTE|nr:glycerate kinase [Vagococcus entomophilus]RSU07373.1 hypothetical protein CBF30_08990 [Vagococcus entomophilus]